MLTARAYDIHATQLCGRVRQVHLLLTGAGIAYRIVGGMVVFMHVSEHDPLRARLTPHIDVAIDRADLKLLAKIAARAGWIYWRVDGKDLLVDQLQQEAGSAVHLFFLNEAVPSSLPDKTREGILIAPVADLLRMKLTSYRLKDRVHIQDMDGVGLIIPAIEEDLPPLLRERLAEIRASE